jgi:hypothetical protein
MWPYQYCEDFHVSASLSRLNIRNAYKSQGSARRNAKHGARHAEAACLVAANGNNDGLPCSHFQCGNKSHPVSYFDIGKIN